MSNYLHHQEPQLYKPTQLTYQPSETCPVAASNPNLDNNLTRPFNNQIALPKLGMKTSIPQNSPKTRLGIEQFKEKI
jgi:hypothetical protein